jgi:nitroreductase
MEMNYDGFLDLIKTRRSIRWFKPDTIPDEHINMIIEAATWAPSALNTQPWEFVVVKDKKLKSEIVRVIDGIRAQRATIESYRDPNERKQSLPKNKGSMNYSNAPVFIILFGDNRTKMRLPLALRYEQRRAEAHFASSLSSAFLYMHLAATTLGLASQWVSAVTVPLAHSFIKHLLGIPEELEIYDMMALGYTTLKPKPKLLRDKSKMIHYDYCNYDGFRTDEEVYGFGR